MREEAEQFNLLMKMEWTLKVSKLAHIKLNEMKLSKTSPLPVPEDLSKISKHVKSGLEALDFRQHSNTSDVYRRAVVLTQTRLLTYNKRRSGELAALSMENYEKRSVGLDEADRALLGSELTDLEKYLIESQQLIKIRGKNSKPVPILVPEDAVPALEYITTSYVRKAAGVKQWNKYVFANAGESVYRAYDSLKTVCGELSLSAPERITSVSMRKYIATLSQVIDMKPHELEWLCSHLGHTADIHKLHYRATSGFIERVNIGKLMLLQDLNVAGQFAGQRLQDIDITDVIKGVSPSRREDTGILENTGVLNEDEFGLRQKLISLYQTEPRFLTTPISPVIQRSNRNIKDLYVPPLMRTVEKETMKPDKDNKVNSIKDIFRDNSKNIYVVGNAGMGKSSLCKKIVSDWCESKSENEPSDTLLTDQKYMQDNEPSDTLLTDQKYMQDNEPSDTLLTDQKCMQDNEPSDTLLTDQKYMQDNETSDDGSSDDTSNSWSSDEMSSSGSEHETSDTLLTDQKYMQDFSFVFYISLRDCNADLKLIDMIKHQLQEEICGFDDETLVSLLEKEKCLIVLDGLDEWTPNTSYGSCSPVNIPARKGVRNCSILTTTRPWKLEAIRLESSWIDKQIELLGIGEHSHMAFIRHMAEQMNPGINSDKFLSSFLEEVENKNLNEFLSIPVILKQLVCIWNQSNELRETKTSVYSQMLNLLFKFAHSRLQDNANYQAIKRTETVSNIQLPMCFKEDKECKEFGSLLYPLSKVAFETLLSDTPEMSLVFEISTTEVHGLTKEQLNICLDIGILSQTKYFLNYTEEHTKISFLHKTYQEFLAALWISLETNNENKQTNIQKFKNKCNTIASMFEFAEFFKFVSGMNSKTACELSEHTREITSQSDIIRKYRQSIDLSNKEVERVQELTISCIKEGWECSHSDCHLYLEDINLKEPNRRDEEEDIDVKDRLIKINKSNIKSLYVCNVDLQSHDNSLLEVCGLEKLLFVKVRDENIIQRLISQSNNTILSLMLSISVFNNVGILHNTHCLTRLSLSYITLSHIDKLGVMSYISQTRRMKEIKLYWVTCKDCGYDECSPVLDLSQHDQLEHLYLRNINVAIDTVVNVTNMVKCWLEYITPVMTFVNVTKSLHNAPKFKDLVLIGTNTPEGVAAIVECISHQKHIERLRLTGIDFGSSELVLSPDYRNLEYVELHSVTMTKRSFRGVIDSILACNQAVRVKVRRLYIKPVEDIEDIVDNVRHNSRCQVMWDMDHKKGKIGYFEFKTIPKQQT